MKVQSQPTRKSARAKVRREVASHQHYSTFSLELLQNDDNTVRRTKVTHVQSSASQTWAEWASAAVISFIESKAQLPHDNTVHGQSNRSASADAIALRVPPQNTDNAVQLAVLGVHREGESGYSPLLQQEQSYALQLALDWIGDKPAQEAKFNYVATILAKALGKAKKIAIGSASGMLAAGENVLIEVCGAKLPPGTYRFTAAVTLRADKALGNGSGLVLVQDGGLVNVY